MTYRKDAIFRMSHFLLLAVLLATVPAWAATTAQHGAATGPRIATGNAFACAIDDAGLVRCWGRNWSGELGDGSHTSRNVPSVVRGIDEPAIAIAAGDYHACALTQSGAVKCWGLNSSGRLGDGSTNDSAIPVDVVGLSGGVSSIAAGGSHTCAITNSAELKCWGRNSQRQLGDLTTTDRYIPVLVQSGISSVATGGSHTCAASIFGWAMCWGQSYRGQLGSGENGASSQNPVDVTGLITGVTAMVAGYQFSCALMDVGSVKCWGANEYGQLGDSTTTDRSTPIEVIGMGYGATMVNGGYYHSCAIQNGAAKCWGRNNVGRLGDGSRIDSLVPVAVTGLATGVQQIDAGVGLSCARMGSGEFFCWGDNSRGQIGSGMVGTSTRPVEVAGLNTGTSAIGVGYRHSCAIKDGSTLCWGDNRFGQLGNGSHDEHITPTQTDGLASNTAALAVGYNHACALTVSGDAKCWGENATGQLGDGTQVDRASPVDVVGLGIGIRQIATAVRNSCAVTAQNGVKCWGSNSYGELGDGTTDDRPVPGDVVGLTSGVTAVSVGYNHSCALLEAGSVKCWGFFTDNLGIGTSYLTPFDMPGLEANITAITSSGNDCVVIDGTQLKCLGSNNYGELGDGTTNDSLMYPVQVVGLDTGVASASAGDAFTCAIDSAGAAKCWGLNENGQLGDGTETFQRNLPVNVVGLDSGMASISAGYFGSCALSATGTAKCWGDNVWGQLGNGETASILLPATVLIEEELFRADFEQH